VTIPDALDRPVPADELIVRVLTVPRPADVASRMAEERRSAGVRGWLGSPGASRAAKIAAGVISAAASVIAIVVAVAQLGGDSPAAAGDVPSRIGAELTGVVVSPATRGAYEAALRASPAAQRPLAAEDVPALLRAPLGFRATPRLATSAGTAEQVPIVGAPVPPAHVEGRVVDFVVTLDGLEGRTAYVTAQPLLAGSKAPAGRPAGEVLLIEPEAGTDRLSSNLFVSPPSSRGRFVVRVSVYDDRGARLNFADSEPVSP
jgi:hypothetical protein